MRKQRTALEKINLGLCLFEGAVTRTRSKNRGKSRGFSAASACSFSPCGVRGPELQTAGSLS